MISYINNIPFDMICEILSLLSYHDLVKIKILNSHWKEIMDNDKIWRYLFLKKFSKIPPLQDNSCKYEYQYIQYLYWDTHKSKSDVIITGENNTTICCSSEQWATSLSFLPLIHNRFYEVEIDKLDTKNTIAIAIGVVFKLNQRYIDKNAPIGYYLIGGAIHRFDGYQANGKIKSNGRTISYSVKKYREGDLIGIRVNFETKKINFYKNGYCVFQLHNNSTKLFKKLYLAVSLIDNSKVTINPIPKILPPIENQSSSCWNWKKSGSQMIINENTVSIVNNKWQTSLSSFVLDHNKFYEIEIDKMKTNNTIAIAIGVVFEFDHIQLNRNMPIAYLPCKIKYIKKEISRSWGYQADGKINFDGHEIAHLEKYGEGDMIGIRVDFEKKEIYFYKSGYHIITLSDQIKKPSENLYLAVSLIDENKVTMNLKPKILPLIYEFI